MAEKPTFSPVDLCQICAIAMLGMMQFRLIYTGIEGWQALQVVDS